MTELTWEGKYDQNGKHVAPLRVSLPFQTVETVNESAQQRQRMLDLFSAGRDPDWRNRLIWGNKNYVLPSLLDEFPASSLALPSNTPIPPTICAITSPISWWCATTAPITW